MASINVLNIKSGSIGNFQMTAAQSKGFLVLLDLKYHVSPVEATR
jgi:hypothetical protein